MYISISIYLSLSLYVYIYIYIYIYYGNGCIRLLATQVKQTNGIIIITIIILVLYY